MGGVSAASEKSHDVDQAPHGHLLEKTTLEPIGTPSAFVIDPDGYHVQI